MLRSSFTCNRLRKSKPFVELNCAAIPDNLLESELFGHEPGAFTDARSKKIGLLEYADGGTLFLDEIGDMPLTMQAKVLKVMETKSFRRVGGLKEIKTDVRIIAATNKDLALAIEKGQFREDLYYRLQVMPIVIPPLRERAEDITHSSEFFSQSFLPNDAQAFDIFRQCAQSTSFLQMERQCA
jgi:transcriptional regulator with PAS, ATPase and Fis domain